MSPGPALLRVSDGGGAVAPGHVTTAAGAGVSAGGRPRPGARGLHLAAAGCWPPLVIATLGHVLNIYKHFTYHTGHMDGQTIYSLAQQILTICTLFTEYLLTFSSLSSDYLLTTY